MSLNRKSSEVFSKFFFLFAEKRVVCDSEEEIIHVRREEHVLVIETVSSSSTGKTMPPPDNFYGAHPLKQKTDPVLSGAGCSAIVSTQDRL